MQFVANYSKGELLTSSLAEIILKLNQYVKSYIIYVFSTDQVFFHRLGDRMAEGGMLPMSLILISFFLMIFLIFKASVNLKSDYISFKKYVSLVNQIALVALVIGLFTQLIGLIQVFDAFESLDNVNRGIVRRRN